MLPTFSTLGDAYDTMYESRRPTLYSSYDVTFEPQRFHKFDRCVGQIDPETNIFTLNDKKKQKECCKKIADLTRTNPASCDQDDIFDVYAKMEKEQERRPYSDALVESYTTPLTKCPKGKFRGPKTGQFTDCPQDQIEPFTTFPYTEVSSLCYPQTPLDNAPFLKEGYTGYLKSKKWVSDKWKYSPEFKQEKKKCDECRYFDNYKMQTRSPLFLHTSTDYEFI